MRRRRADRLAEEEEEELRNYWDGQVPDDPRLWEGGWEAATLMRLDPALVHALVDAGDETRRAVTAWCIEHVLADADLLDRPWAAPALAALRDGRPLPNRFDLTATLPPMPIAPGFGDDPRRPAARRDRYDVQRGRRRGHVRHGVRCDRRDDRHRGSRSVPRPPATGVPAPVRRVTGRSRPEPARTGISRRRARGARTPSTASTRRAPASTCSSIWDAAPHRRDLMHWFCKPGGSRQLSRSGTRRPHPICENK